MPKSRGRPKYRSGGGNSEQSQPPPHKRNIWGKIKSVPGVIVTIGTTSGVLLGAYSTFLSTSPEIKLSGQHTSPFLLPFAVKNPSSLFSMYDVQWECLIKRAQIGQISVTNSIVTYVHTPATILPGSIANFGCNLTSGPADRAVIAPRVSYRTLGIARLYEQAAFTWLGHVNPPRWIEGDSPN